MSTTPDRHDPVDDPSQPGGTSQPDDTQPVPDAATPPPPPPAEFSSDSASSTSEMRTEASSEPGAEAPADHHASASTPPPPPAPQTPPPSAPQSPPPPPSGSGGDYGAPAGYGSAPAYNAPAGAVAPLSPQEEKGWSLAAHLLVLVGGFVAPLIIWLVFKGRGPFLEHHAKESLNFQITVMIAMFVAVVLTFLLIGIVLILALVPWMVIMPILAAVKSNNGEWYRYPLTLRLIK